MDERAGFGESIMRPGYVEVRREELVLLGKIRRLALCVSLRDPEFDIYMAKLQDALMEYRETVELRDWRKNAESNSP